MNSKTPKVFHTIAGLPSVQHVRRAAQILNPRQIIITLDPQTAADYSIDQQMTTAVQAISAGTADAVAAGVDRLDSSVNVVVVLNGDVPLIRPESLRSMVCQHQEHDRAITVATFLPEQPAKYGRIVRHDGNIVAIVEASDDPDRPESGVEANGGVYVFDAQWLRDNIGNVPVSSSGEYYLTSLIELFARQRTDQRDVGAVCLSEAELLGVDDRVRLAIAEATMRRRLIDQHLVSGVTIVDPDRTVIGADVTIARDARIEPGTFLYGKTTIGEDAVIGPYSVIEDSEIGDGARIIQSWVSGSRVRQRTVIGPFSRIRPETDIGPDVRIGNFVETKATTIGAHSHVHHVSYLGDATLGSRVNIGAGTITCNYDGVAKHPTVIGDDVFVGCDTMLVAPVDLGNGSRTGAGAVVTRSVPPGKTVVGVPARPLERAKSKENHGR